MKQDLVASQVLGASFKPRTEREDVRLIAEGLILSIDSFEWHKSDCWTMVCQFYAEWSGVQLPTYDYGVEETFPPEEAYKHWSRVPMAQIRPGDLIIFHHKGLMHVGICLDQEEFLHTLDIGHKPLRVSKIKPYTSSILGFARLKIDNN
ncbi:MAG: NlpC/P60 family protein [Candidatus Thorarchaeota archaeon]|jgi:cell wall-associated NlpC family hydrolase